MLREKSENVFKKIDKKKWYRVISCILFIVLCMQIVVSLTYLFRNNKSDRLRVVGLKEEKELDMIYIGASAAFVYWQPLKAWKDYGFTSYNYAVNTVQAEGIKYLMKEALKTHKPELFVVDLRPFQYWEPTMLERGARTIADQIDYSWNRFEFLNYYFLNREKDENADYLSYYLEISKYHMNREALQKREHWKLIDNTGLAENKGWETKNTIHSFEKPQDFMTNERAELQEKIVLILEDLLKYCEDNELKVLFTVCPYVIEEEHQKKYNALRDIIEARGFHYINTNEYYYDMQIDFETDFYDKNHVNCLGSEKYTRFLGDYVVEAFNLPDNRGNENYKNWDDEYVQFAGLIGDCKKELGKIILNMEQAKKSSEKINGIEKVYEWEMLTRSDGLMLLINGEITNEVDDIQTIVFLKQWGIDIERDKKTNYVAVIEQGNVLYSEQGDDLLEYSGKIEANTSKEKEYSIDSVTKSIVIGGEEYSLKGKGLNVVVYNKYLQKVVDSINIYLDNEGDLKVER